MISLQFNHKHHPLMAFHSYDSLGLYIEPCEISACMLVARCMGYVCAGYAPTRHKVHRPVRPVISSHLPDCG